jgi:hypothetical protein
VGIGNIDDDALVELVVNNRPAHILCPGLKIEKWNFGEGSYGLMETGDVDGDQLLEIVTLGTYGGVYVMDVVGTNLPVLWQRSDVGAINAISVADLDGNGIGEVIIGNDRVGSVSGYQGSTGEKLWSIPNPDDTVSGIGVGDPDDDGVREVLWSTGLYIGGKDSLIVGNWGSQSLEWATEDLDGPFLTAAGDVDNDGQVELIMASHSTSGGYENGMIRTYDGATHQLEWSALSNGPHLHFTHLAIGQLDGDAALEILVGVDQPGSAVLQVYDGLSHVPEWSSPDLGSEVPLDVILGNLDEDPVEEIAVVLNYNRVQVLNGASSQIQWDSGILDGTIRSLAHGDLDGNGVVDLAVLTVYGVYVFEAGSWTQKHHKGLINGNLLVAILPASADGPGELLLVTGTDYVNNTRTLQAWSGTTFATAWQYSLGSAAIENLEVADVDSDGVMEIVVMGGLGNERSYVGVANRDYPYFWEHQMEGSWGLINSAALSDLDNDGQKEFLFGSSQVIQVNEILTTSSSVSLMYLPLIKKPRPSQGLFGRVTVNGAPGANFPLSLRFMNGNSWSTIANTTTQSDGWYSFTGVPSLNPGQAYYVLYQNPDLNTTWLWAWHTRSIGSYTAGGAVHMGDFDLADIALITPGDGVSVHLPATFRWLRRPASFQDSYEFNLFDPYDGDPYFWTDPPLGYVDSYTLTSLPSGFNVGNPYVWEIWVYSPDGGFGVSCGSEVVRFSNAGANITTDGQSTHPRTIPPDGLPRER